MGEMEEEVQLDHQDHLDQQEPMGHRERGDCREC